MFFYRIVDPETGWLASAKMLCPEVIANHIASPRVQASEAMQAEYRKRILSEARTMTASYGEVMPGRPGKIRAALERITNSGFLDDMDPRARQHIEMFTTRDPAKISQLSADLAKHQINELARVNQQLMDGFTQVNSQSVQAVADMHAQVNSDLKGEVHTMAQSNVSPQHIDGFVTAFVDQTTPEVQQRANNIAAGASTPFQQVQAQLTELFTQVTELSVRAVGLASIMSVAMQAEVITGTMTSALTSSRNLVGLSAGVDVAIKLFPFAISCMTGILKGVTTFKRLARLAAHIKQDDKVIHRYAVVLVVTVVSVMSMPLLLVPIFIFQFLTTYWFCMAIIGMAMAIVGYLCLVFQEDTQNESSIFTAFLTATGGGRNMILAASLQGVGWALFIAGVAIEMLMGRVGVFVSINWLSVVRTVASFLLGMYLSLATTVALAKASAEYFFGALEDVYYVNDAATLIDIADNIKDSHAKEPAIQKSALPHLTKFNHS